VSLAYFFTIASEDGVDTPAHRAARAVVVRERIAVQQETDDAIAGRIRAGEIAAFESVFRAHVEVLNRVAYTYVDSVDAARDVVHDVFLGLWTHRATFTPTTGVRAYLLGAVRNRALNVKRDRGTRAALLHDVAKTGECHGASASLRQPDEIAEADDTITVLRRAIDALPEAQRVPMSLRWREQLEVTEIAVALGVSENAVRIQLSRGLATLRRAVPQLFR
jgi:RNA polymerase sigma factor (sigma-70 family)